MLLKVESKSFESRGDFEKKKIIRFIFVFLFGILFELF